MSDCYLLKGVDSVDFRGCLGDLKAFIDGKWRVHMVSPSILFNKVKSGLVHPPSIQSHSRLILQAHLSACSRLIDSRRLGKFVLLATSCGMAKIVGKLLYFLQHCSKIDIL